MKTLLVILTLCLVHQSFQCNSTNVYQYTCHETSETSSITELATQLKVNPLKLCEMNSQLSNCNSVPSGSNMIVPNDTCLAKQGSWECHTVQEGDTLDSISRSNIVKKRSIDLIKEYNEDLLWNSETLYEGMPLRLPTKFCIDDMEHDLYCYDVQSGETLQNIAQHFGTTKQFLLANNEETLAGIESLNEGMQILVPKSVSSAPVPCVENSQWSCYTVQEGDSLFEIGNSLGYSPNLIQEWNGIDDASNIWIGESLALMKYEECTDKPGQHTCETLQIQTSRLPGALQRDWTDATVYNPTDEYAELVYKMNRNKFSEKDYDVSQGGVEVYQNQVLRIPYYHVVPNLNQTYHIVHEEDGTLYNNVGDQYELGSTIAYDSFDGTIMKTYYTRIGMDLRIYRPTVDELGNAIEDCKHTPESYWCYKLIFGDTVSLVEEKLQTQGLCEYNQLEDCNTLRHTGTLKIPIKNTLDLVENSNNFLP